MRAKEAGGARALRVVLSLLQAGLCVVLLIGAGLFVESLRRSRAVDLGFQPNHVLRAYAAFSLDGPHARGARGRARRATPRRSQQAIGRLKAAPWVEDVALSVGTSVRQQLRRTDAQGARTRLDSEESAMATRRSPP